MKIWIDADACPKAVKELVFRASERLKLPVIMVADRRLGRPGSRLVSTVVVPRDMDSADKYIAEHLDQGDLVITADLPLAQAVVARGSHRLKSPG